MSAGAGMAGDYGRGTRDKYGGREQLNVNTTILAVRIRDLAREMGVSYSYAKEELEARLQDEMNNQISRKMNELMNEADKDTSPT